MARDDDKTLAVVGTLAWIGLAIPGTFFALVGFIGMGFSSGRIGDLALGWFLILFPILAIGSVVACWLLRGLDRPQAARIAILLPAIPAIVEVVLMADMTMR